MKKYCLILILCSMVGLSKAQEQHKRPNVIIILADDLGWADLSCYGSRFYETPNLDRLASSGIKFSYAYASSPVCSPTRASLLTGKNPVRTGVTDWIKGRQEGGKAMSYEKLIAKPTAYELALEETTLAEVALSNGYSTYHVGKWHLGEEEKFWPKSQGFQHNIGGWSKGGPYGRVNDSTGGYFTPYKNPTIKDGPPGEYLTDRLTDECLAFLQQSKNKPFFLMYSLYSVHNPLQAPDALIKKYDEKGRKLTVANSDRFAKDEPWMKNETGWRRRLVQDHAVYAAMIENMDTNVGRIVEKVKQLGIDDNTLIIFTSDNGGLSTAEGSPTSNAPLRNGKGWLHEGGIRVPFILYWKNNAAPGESTLPVITSDIYSTIATAINPSFKKSKQVEGGNIVALINSKVNPDRKLFWHYPHYSNQGGKPASAMRHGNLKLILNYEDNSVELYDVINDISEKTNLAATLPEKTSAMKRELLTWLKKNEATFPDRNPKFVP